jgi:ATP-binding cassette subfamily F protein 3
VEIGHGDAQVFPGTYSEFLWHKENKGAAGAKSASGAKGAAAPRAPRAPNGPPAPNAPAAPGSAAHDERKKQQAADRKRDQEHRKREARIADLESRIAEREQAIRDLEASMAEPGFYDHRATSQPLIDRHQALMWEVGELMHQWEELQRLTERDTN